MDAAVVALTRPDAVESPFRARRTGSRLINRVINTHRLIELKLVITLTSNPARSTIPSR